MKPLFEIGSTCPSCGNRGRFFSVLRALQRRNTATCSKCGNVLLSEISFTKYVLLIVYAHLVLAILALPFVLSLAGGQWLLSAVVFGVFALLIGLPAILLHARSIQVQGTSAGERR